MLNKSVLIISIIVINFILKQTSANKEFTTYRAAVLEYSPNFQIGDDPKTIYSVSVPNYEDYIQKAALNNVDIIVFPEAGLSGLGVPAERNRIKNFAVEVPSVDEKTIPCTSKKYDNDNILKKLSCAASKNQIYVALNLIETFNCSNEIKCPDDNVFYYNTNVVLDRNGVVIARYRKFNLFYEPGFNITVEPEYAIFTTDFGVKFGMFICFDISYKKPALELIRQYDVHDIIYSAAWFSELPFLTALQTHFGFAYSNNITLLGSGYNNPANKNTGSGIYLGKHGTIRSIFALSRVNTMLIADVPKYPYTSNVSTLVMNIDNTTVGKTDEIEFFQDDLSKYKSDILTENYNKTICSNNLCCNFEINGIYNSDSIYVYRAMVFSGSRKFVQVLNAGIEVCGIVSCLNNTIESCGLRQPNIITTNITFNHIRIVGNFKQNADTFFWPATINTQLKPYEPSQFQYNNNKINIELLSNHQFNNLLTFAIYGRDFAQDS